MSGVVWIDLTDMVGWKGQFGGTQRVVYGIAEEFYQNKDSQLVKFCVFDEKEASFHEYDFEIIRGSALRVAHSVKESDAISKKAYVREMIVQRIPRKLLSNEKLRHAGKKGAKAIYRPTKKGHVISKAIFSKSTRSTTHQAGNRVNFVQEDTVLLLGKPWDTPTMLPKLADMKLTTNFKLVAIVYDLVIPLYPHLHTELLFKDYTQYMFELAQAADLVLPISESSKKDYEIFCKKLSLPCPEQHVIRLGDRLESVAKPMKPTGPIAKNYVLSVGTIEVRKNHALLYNTYKLAEENGIELPQLIIVGRLGWNSDDIYRLMTRDEAVHNKILIMESVSDSELAWLYEHCLFTVYPSMYEGWGLPVAESIQYGKLVASSNASSMPEIAGELLDYFSPYSAGECLSVMTRYLNDEIRAKAEDKIKNKYKTTTWRDTYNEIERSLRHV